MKASLRIGRIAGIEIGIHYTWLLAVIFISWSLAVGFFPAYFPGWSTTAYWATAILAACLLFASVLVHELAHSLVALGRGLPAHGITLFIFGGVSTISAEAKRPRDEFVIAIVGPITSLVLAGIFWGLLQIAGGGNAPVSAILSYLALINVSLAGFNLLPGFPLDGGRVLRSILWGRTGSLERATRIASFTGQVFGWLLIGYGVFQVLHGNFLSGLWIAFIGWFLNSAADASRQEVMLQRLVGDVPVAQIMEPNPDTVAPDTSVKEVVEEHLLRRGRRALPVGQGDRLLGIVTLTDIKRLPQQEWPKTPVSQIMTSSPLYSVGPEDNVNTAMGVLAEQDVNQVLVLQDGRLLGLLSRSNIIRYLKLGQALKIQPKQQEGIAMPGSKKGG